jgi:DNA-binding CsgD family transcriptional regulator
MEGAPDRADAGRRPYPADRDRFLTVLDRVVVADASGGAVVTAPDASDAAALVRAFALRHPECRSISPASLVIDPSSAELSTLAAAWEKVVRMSEERPLLVVVDAADPSTKPYLAVLQFFARRSAGTQVALLFSAADMDDRLSESGLPIVRLPANEAPVLGIWRPAPDDHGELPDSPRQTALDTLSASARRLLHATAVLGEADIDVALRASSGAELSDLDDLERAGLVVVAVERIRLPDDALRSAIYRNLTPDERRAAHLGAATALEGGGDDDLRAWQLAAAVFAPDRDAADTLLAAVEQAGRRGGPSLESMLLERAGELTEEAGRQGTLFVRAALAAWRAGLDRRAQRLLEQAESTDDPEARAIAVFVAGAIAQRTDHPEGAFELLVAAATAAARQPSELAVELTSRVASIAWWAGRQDWSHVAVAICERSTPTTSSPFGRFVAAAIPAGLRMLRHDFTAIPGILAAFEEAESLEGRQLVFASEVAGLIGDDHRALRLQGEAITSIREDGTPAELPLALELSAFANAWHGQLDAAAAAADQALELAEKYGERHRGPFQFAMLAHVAALRGDEADCRRFAAEALSGSANANPATARWALGRLELSLDRPAEAYRELSEIYSGAARHPITVLYAAPDFVEAAVDVGSLDEAAEVARLFRGWAAGGSPWGRAMMPRLNALLSDDETAVDLFERSLQGRDGTLRPYDRARTQLLLGRWLRKLRRRIDSREHLRAALASFTQLGMESWAAQARAELRASGETTTSAPKHALTVLTAQEAEVARLVTTGVSNRDVAERLHLSPRTVEYHLAKVYVKLGISSRTQLAAALGAV